MKLKKSLLLSTAISTVTAAAIVSLGYLNVSQASSTAFLKPNATAQTLPEQTPQTVSESPSEQLDEGIGKAMYMLEDPAIQFTYDPDSFVLETFKSEQSEVQSLRISSISFWSKEDYLTIKNAGDELGDFPEKLSLATYSNPDGIPVIDWLSSSPGDSLGIEVENLSRQADTTIAGRDAWTFSYQALFEYDGIAFQDGDGRMVVITAYKPPAESATEGNEDYLSALSKMVESMELTMPASETTPTSD